MLDSNPGLEKLLVDSVTLTDTDSRLDLQTPILLDVRLKFVQFLRSKVLILSDNAHIPVTDDDLASPFCSEIFHQWAVWTQDAAADVALWTRNGAPASITVNFDQLSGLMPPVVACV